MQKITIPILSTLIAGLVFSPISNASAAIVDKDTIWWSVSELLDYYKEVETERVAICGEDFDCNMDFEMNHYENSEKYRALHNILEGQIWVTSINPTDETIKVLFYDEDMMLKHMGIHENLELEHFYFGWFDEWDGQIYNYDHDRFTDGSMPDSHPLYDSTIEDLSIITPWEEIELSVAGGNLINNPTGKIDYAAFAKDNKFNAQGHFDYNSCLRADDYTYGAECQLMSSGDQGYAYFPPRGPIAVEDIPIQIPDDDCSGDSTVAVFVPTTEPVIEDTESDDESGATHIPSAQLTGKILPPGEEEPIDDSTSDMANAQETEDDGIRDDLVTDSIVFVQTPETGAPTSGEPGIIEFPWWLGTIIALNGLTLAWLFLPTRTKSPKASANQSKNKKQNQGITPSAFLKSHFSTKKCQKTLDKNYQLR